MKKNNAECQKQRDKISMFQSSALRACSRCGEMPQEAWSWAGIESKKVKLQLHAEHASMASCESSIKAHTQ